MKHTYKVRYTVTVKVITDSEESFWKNNEKIKQALRKPEGLEWHAIDSAIDVILSETQE